MAYICCMKSTLTTLFLIISFSCASQKILVPYRSGNQFGLSDEKGKIIITPQFDQVNWMQGGWFRTGKNIRLNDTVAITAGRNHIRNTQVKLSGLIYYNNIILKDEPFGDYEIVANKCIVAKYEGRGGDLTKEQLKKYGNQRKLYSLFNLRGENLYPENFRRIQKVDTAGTSNTDKKLPAIFYL